MHESLISMYGNRVRIRVCGLCWQGDRLLMVNHSGLGERNFWAPPGGGVEFGSTIHQNLEREMEEETGLQVQTGVFRFACEFLRPPLHSVDLFFETHLRGGVLLTGTDPELNIIREVRFMGWNEILGIPLNELHGVFRQTRNAEEFRKLTGFHSI